MFIDINKTKIPVVEQFNSLQGEGPEMGTSTYFTRVGGCNMTPKCTFCDTKYSWQNNDIINSNQLNLAVLQLNMLESRNNHFTFTGGEPTIYDKEINEIRKRFHAQHFSLETNGLIKTMVNYDTIVVSPKKQNFNLDVLTEYAKMDNAFFKFVYENKNDLWWEEIISNCSINKNNVYIMPEGKTVDKQLNKMPEVFDYCNKTHYKFSPRLHVLTWNDKTKI